MCFTVELLTKSLISLNIARHGKKKDALWRQFMYERPLSVRVSVLRFKVLPCGQM